MIGLYNHFLPPRQIGSSEKTGRGGGENVYCQMTIDYWKKEKMTRRPERQETRDEKRGGERVKGRGGEEDGRQKSDAGIGGMSNDY